MLRSVLKSTKAKAGLAFAAASLVALQSQAVVVIGAPIFIAQAIGGLAIWIFDSKSTQPQQLFEIQEDRIYLDVNAFNKKSDFIQNYAATQCKDWREHIRHSSSDLKLVTSTRMELMKLDGSVGVFSTSAYDHKLKTAVLLIAMEDFAEASRRYPNSASKRANHMRSQKDFARYMKWLGCRSADEMAAYKEVRAWAHAHGLPYFN